MCLYNDVHTYDLKTLEISPLHINNLLMNLKEDAAVLIDVSCFDKGAFL